MATHRWNASPAWTLPLVCMGLPSSLPEVPSSNIALICIAPLAVALFVILLGGPNGNGAAKEQQTHVFEEILFLKIYTNLLIRLPDFYFRVKNGTRLVGKTHVGSRVGSKPCKHRLIVNGNSFTLASSLA